MKQEKEILDKLLDDVKVFMMVTSQGEGKFIARPMTVAERDNNSDFLFFTSVDTEKTYEVLADSQVLLTYQDGSRYISLAGTASVEKDKNLIHTLWKEPYRVWFPDGPTDKKIAIIRFIPQEAEYWDNKGLNKMKFLFKSFKAYVSGTTPKNDRTEHGEVKDLH